MISTMVFLVFWVADQPLPTARFIQSYKTADECYDFIARSKMEREIKKQLACIEMGAALAGTKKL